MFIAGGGRPRIDGVDSDVVRHGIAMFGNDRVNAGSIFLAAAKTQRCKSERDGTRHCFYQFI
jgi:hypothetical protein